MSCRAPKLFRAKIYIFTCVHLKILKFLQLYWIFIIFWKFFTKWKTCFFWFYSFTFGTGARQNFVCPNVRILWEYTRAKYLWLIPNSLGSHHRSGVQARFGTALGFGSAWQFFYMMPCVVPKWGSFFFLTPSSKKNLFSSLAFPTRFLWYKKRISAHLRNQSSFFVMILTFFSIHYTNLLWVQKHLQPTLPFF